ncbi:alpha/beta hydrolase [Dictyobacter aurantiacus]|uniref:Phospholipase/carboxylesterase n=1 Tax=Dictyobacter aurantiacus TaxID=1936993 RepID=A0A401ZDL1_9CHLR|nr:alpha/beta hydrolase [Dictyobacter aurantiacus]GCE04929.1 phospholipase/carboxylesterase [Dictyobacter aurantiacus]
MSTNEKNITGQELVGYVHRFIAASGSVADQQPTPTLLLLHGTGGTEEDLLSLGNMLFPGAAMLSPRGNVLEDGMSRFFRRLAEGVFDLDDLHRRTGELTAFVRAAAETYHFDPSNVIAVGYSNGANIAASMLLSSPGVLRGAILLRPMVPFIPDQLPDLSGTSVFVSAGRMDPIVPQAQTEQLIQLLQQAGASVHANWLNGGHGIGLEDVRAARSWLVTNL